jgi:hypothetical protein
MFTFEYPVQAGRELALPRDAVNYTLYIND